MGPTHLSDADGGLSPWPDAEPLVLQEGRVVMPMNHDLDASLHGQQREVVLLLSLEDQADPWDREGGEARLAWTPPAPLSLGLALTMGDARVLCCRDAIEGVAAAIGGVVECLEVPGTRSHTHTRIRPWPRTPLRVA